MGFALDSFHGAVAALTGSLLLMVIAWVGWQRVARRREAQRRIEGARVRSGHVPLEIPTVRGGLGGGNTLDTAPETLPPGPLPEMPGGAEGEAPIVDERPRIRVRYRNRQGQKIECTIQVERLDLRKRLLICRGDLPGGPHRLPLHAITTARIADSGQRFDVDMWADAVRAARRRRGEI